MRKLTLDEKISFKGLLSCKGVSCPKLTTTQLLFYWPKLYGCPITKWAKVRKTNKLADLNK